MPAQTPTQTPAVVPKRRRDQLDYQNRSLSKTASYNPAADANRYGAPSWTEAQELNATIREQTKTIKDNNGAAKRAMARGERVQ
jgi:hypothetical protein